MRERDTTVAIAALDNLLRRLQLQWIDHAVELFQDTEGAADGPVDAARQENHAKSVEDGVSQFSNLFRSAEDALQAGDTSKMRELFVLAVESHFTDELRSTGPTGAKRADELTPLRYTFYGLHEDFLFAWQKLLRECGVLKRGEDIINKYAVPDKK